MVSWQWRWLAKRAHADRYVEHLRRETFPTLAKIPGFITATILKHEVEQGIEFLIVTHWQSLEAIEKFAGRDPEVAVVPASVQEMMLDYDRTVRHYEVVDEDAAAYTGHSS